MGFVFRTHGMKEIIRITGGYKPPTSQAASVARNHPLAKSCYALEGEIYDEARIIISDSSIATTLVPSSIPRVDLLEVCVLPKEGKATDYFIMTSAIMLLRRSQAFITLYFSVSPDSLKERHFDSSIPALVAHEIGHVISPASDFRFDHSNETALPFNRRIVFPQVDETPGITKEIMADLCGLFLLPQANSREEIRKSFRDLINISIISRLNMTGQESDQTALSIDARFIAAARYLNDRQDSPFSKELLAKYGSQRELVNAAVDRYLSFMFNTKII